MLQELEEWPSTGLLVAATNHPELVDPALWRRFDCEIVLDYQQMNKSVMLLNYFPGMTSKYSSRGSIYLKIACMDSPTAISNVKSTSCEGYIFLNLMSLSQISFPISTLT